VVSRDRVVKRWIAAGKLKPIEPKFLFYMATTQQYANAAHEMANMKRHSHSLAVAAVPSADGALDRVIGVAPGPFAYG
jgi:YcdC-like protein, C-terminal region